MRACVCYMESKERDQLSVFVYIMNLMVSLGIEEEKKKRSISITEQCLRARPERHSELKGRNPKKVFFQGTSIQDIWRWISKDQWCSYE